MRIRRLVLFLVMICGAMVAVSAHSNFILHGEDVMSVMGLKNDTRLFSRSRDSKKNNSWVKFISSDMIDNTAFHKELESDYPGLSIKGPRRHRMLFHWAYDTEPWNIGVELLMTEYCEVQDLNVESNLRVLRAKLVTEQRRRNKLIITRTQEVFGFDKDGRAERIYTRFFASMAYNIHILGDYTTDNTVLEGLYDFDKLVGKLVVELRSLDRKGSKPLVAGITAINSLDINVQQKADLLMDYLKREVPAFLKTACGGDLKRRIEAQGYEFK